MAYCNTDHVNSPDHGHFVTGYIVLVGCGAISCSVKKQTATIWSTAEVEYYTSMHTGQEVAWLHQLLLELGFSPFSTMTLCIDNTSVIHMITQPNELTHCSKHICLAYHWICETAEEMTIAPAYIESSYNVTNILTKLLLYNRHWSLTLGLGIHACTHAS